MNIFNSFIPFMKAGITELSRVISGFREKDDLKKDLEILQIIKSIDSEKLKYDVILNHINNKIITVYTESEKNKNKLDAGNWISLLTQSLMIIGLSYLSLSSETRNITLITLPSSIGTLIVYILLLGFTNEKVVTTLAIIIYLLFLLWFTFLIIAIIKNGLIFAIAFYSFCELSSFFMVLGLIARQNKERQQITD